MTVLDLVVAEEPGAPHPSPTIGATVPGAPVSPWEPAPPSPVLRLLAPVADTSYAAHLRYRGPLTLPADLVAEVARAGLRGRGGAGFPTAQKIAAVRAATRRRRPVVVANGAEGEPLSAKDRLLLQRSPHLVLDGMTAAASAVGAHRAILCVKSGAARMAAALAVAVEERPAGPVALEVVTVPDGYVAGEESALVHWLNSGRAQPLARPPRPDQRGVGRCPTLVDNVETLAHVALIARGGGARWRALGTGDDPGSLLVTVTGAVARPGVQEVAHGAPLAEVLRRAGATTALPVLVGGYFGTWLTADQAAVVRLRAGDLAPLGAGLGCGAIAVLPPTACPLEETARVARWLAHQSAGQCGPCVHGLPAIATALDAVAASGDPRGEDEARRLGALVTGRGACKLPDGTARFVTSALDVFADHVAQHRRHGPCAAAGGPAVLPTPPRGERR
jgi:NADH:ubiquinone oxidoreductase subunit F (NADH-binding)